MTRNNSVSPNSKYASGWRKELWGYFSKKSSKEIRKKITLPKYDCIERFYEETKETKTGERTARDIRKSYYN